MYTITPITCATFETYKGSLTYLTDQCLSVEIPILSFLLEPTRDDDDTVILVDTGFKQPDRNGEVKGNYLLTGGGVTPIERALKTRDLLPEDVTHVVLTHLHHDHCSNNAVFTEAEFYVQDEELDAANEPMSHVERTYDGENTAGLETLDPTVLDGDHELRPGIELWHLPGHTEGMQGVMVDTDAGTYALVSDLAYCSHNLSPRTSEMVDASGQTVAITFQDCDYILPGIHVSIAACFESIRRVRNHVDGNEFILPSHDPELMDESIP